MAAAATKSGPNGPDPVPEGRRTTETEDFTVQVGISHIGRWYGLHSETVLQTPYDATLEVSVGWSSQVLPCLGEPPRRALIPGSINAWTSN